MAECYITAQALTDLSDDDRLPCSGSVVMVPTVGIVRLKGWDVPRDQVKGEVLAWAQ